MSIWSTIASLEGCEPLGYHPRDTTDGPLSGGVDLASAIPWYGGNGLRLTVREAQETTIPPNWRGCIEAEVVINRQHASELRDALTHWLETTTG